MSHTNLSRRAILAGAASVPALALPAAVAVALPAIIEPAAAAPAAAVIELPNPDAALIALGEQLKPAVAKADKLQRVSSRLYEACRKAAGFRYEMTQKQRDAAHSRFKAMSKENGYTEAAHKWNDACEPRNKLAGAILKIPSHTRIGDGVRAAATLVDNAGDMDGVVETMLWEMAARAGFKPPAEIAKTLRRRGVAVAKAPKQLDAKVLRAQAQMVEANKASDKLLSERSNKDIDCEDVPGFLELEDQYYKAIDALVKTPARSLEGLAAKAQATVYPRLCDENSSPRHRALAVSLARDLLKYVGTPMA